MQLTPVANYEMLWDCPQCGSTKLLGLTHRHCPNCGGAQDPTRRYYPSDADKVLASNHVYAGADLVCRACNTPNGARSLHCAACGCPLDGATAAPARSEQLAGAQGFAGESVRDAQAEARARRQALVDTSQRRKPPMSTLKKVAIGIGIAFAVILVFTMVCVFWKREVTFEVTGLSWKREIDVESFGPVSDSAWCDSMPRGAYSVQRNREVRDHKKIPDGEDCHTRRVDNRDGTFKEVRECTPKYRDEPIYDMRCHYSIDRWSVARTLESHGNDAAATREWPEVGLARTGQCKGCEREGSRRETLSMAFVDTKGEAHACDVPEALWTSAKVGEHWLAEVSVMTSHVDCDSLKKQP